LLLNELYTIQSQSVKENQLHFLLHLEADHAIFKGHFPGQPVLPGVCMLEMIAELTGRSLHQRFRISGGPVIKFLNMIDPRKNRLIEVGIEYQIEKETVAVQGKIFHESFIFMKYKLVLLPLM